MPNARHIFIGLAGSVGLGLVMAIWWLWGHPYAADALVYRRAPDYVFDRLDPATARFEPSRDWAGRPYLISFFASWCMPCHVEHPVLLELSQTTKLAMIGVAENDRPVDTQRMLQKMGNPYQLVLSDFSGDGATAWGLRGVPESFIVNAAGQTVWHHVGPVTEAVVEEQIKPLAAQLLGSP
jgi:cytochrome c biogenesis protein CcmG/thiol:disulfide interchange protein DsbE